MIKKITGAAALALALTACDHSNETRPMNKFTVQGSYEAGSYEDFKATAGDRVFFALNSATLSHDAKAHLDKQISWLMANPNVNITLEGHADERGTVELNLALGDRRAHSAKRYMISKGINESRISSVSFGKARPAALGHNESAWAQNRRVVTIVHN